MNSLRDTLDESEKQVAELEHQKAELRKTLDETQQKVERLSKSNKVTGSKCAYAYSPS